MAIALETIVKQLEDSGIVAAGKLKDFVPPNAHPKDTEELLRELHKQNLLTKFQAQQVAAGKVKALILGGYTILDKIGAGGMGQVFKAEHRRMKRLVAIKTLPASTMKDAAAVARFQREVEAAAKLRHTNIVAADDADEANGVHFLVMEYIDGKDLSATVKKNGPFPVAKAVNYILQAARGLEFAHKKGVVHRDIKPANLLLDSEGTVKILDMGLARIDQGDGEAQAELTGTGAVMGTVDYMSPEQAMNTKSADARADIYSLGCSLHYLIAGKATYSGNTAIEKLLAHRDQPIPNLREVSSDVSAELEAVFEKMVAKNVEDRYQTMTEVVADLEKCSSGQSTSVSIQQTGSTNLANSALTFMPNIQVAPTIQKTRVTKQAAPAKSSEGKQPPWKNTNVLIGAGAAGFLFLLLGVWVIIRDKVGNEVAKVKVPDGGSVKVQEVKKSPFTKAAKKTEVVGKADSPFKVGSAPGKLFMQDPAFQQWVKATQALPADEQIEAVSKKLMELNPGFDGQVTGHDGDGNANGTPKIVGGVVTGIGLVTDNVTDISPLRALAGLKGLVCIGNVPGKGRLSDLSPLQGMRLTFLSCLDGQLADLSPLRGMPLTFLRCGGRRISDLSPLHGMKLEVLLCLGTQVSDLIPLQGMPLTYLDIGNTLVSDLSPLRGMKLTRLECYGTQVTDLSPLKGMPLTTLRFFSTQVSDLSPLDGMKLTQVLLTPKDAMKGLDVIRQMKSLQTIGIGGKNIWPPDEFWKKYDAGEFGKPASPTKITNINDPAFQAWIKEVQAMPADKQVEAVSKKLTELNPGFDGKVAGADGKGTPKIDNNVVTELGFVTDNVTDISPVRALAGLVKLLCHGSSIDKEKVKIADLSPLIGMQLTSLNCPFTNVSDLSPLRGLKLTYLNCGGTQVSDLTPLESCKSLKVLFITETKVTPTSVAALQNSLPNCKIHWDDPAKAAVQPNKPWNTPTFQAWMKDVQAMPADKQIEAVSKKLMELNPGFDGKVTPKSDSKGVVHAIIIGTENVADISPVRVFTGLKELYCSGSSRDDSMLADLSPLSGLRLEACICNNNPQLADLSPLREMPLVTLNCEGTQVSDLSPLAGCGGLKSLRVNRTKVTPAQVAALQKALPNCKIEWDDPAKPKTPQPAASGTK